MKIDPVSILLNENFKIDKKIYFISGNEKTLMQKIKATIVEKYQKNTNARITNIDTVKDFVEDVNRARVIKAKHIMDKLNGQDISKAMPVNQDEFIDRFIDKIISEKPEDLVIQDKDKNNVGFLSTKKLSEILKR